MAKRCSNEVRPSSARILPLQWERKASHLIQQIPSGNLFPLSPQGEGRVQRLPLEGKLPPWAADEVLLTYILPLRCGRKAFHLIHRKRSPFPSRGRQKPFLQPGSKRSPHSVRRSSGRTPRTRSGLRCRYGSWSPVGTVQDRPRRQSRTALDTCHRHAAPPFLRKVPGFFRPERSESIFC